MIKHGGARRGAGRPLKWTFDDIFTVGQACEAEWRRAAQDAVEVRLSALPKAAEIRSLQEASRNIPLEQRRAWLAGDAFDDHHHDIEALLHARAKTSFDDDTATFERTAPRGVRVSAQPFRGSRKRIIAGAALRFQLSESQVDNLWQRYRRIESEPIDPHDHPT